MRIHEERFHRTLETESETPDCLKSMIMLTKALKTCPVTIFLSVLVLVTGTSPTIAEWFEFENQLVGDGQWWRIWTGHLAHYHQDHLFWDLLMFMVLGAMVERAYPRQFGVALLSMMAGVTAIVAFTCDGIQVYRGLSGLDTGLFVWLVVDQCRRRWIDGDRVAGSLWLSALIGLNGKLLFEAFSGQTLFVDSSSFTPLVESHLAGAGLGLLLALLVPHTSCEQSVAIDPRPSSVLS